MSTKKICPFCNDVAELIKKDSTEQFIFKDCLCGKFVISQEAFESKEYEPILTKEELKILFSGYLRNNQTTSITYKFIKKELKDILYSCQNISLDAKISMIKKYLYDKTTSIEKSISIDYKKLYTLFYLKNPSELIKLVEYLKKKDFLIMEDGVVAFKSHISLTVNGFSKMESSLKNQITSKMVFIACEFGTDYQDDLVKTIKKACTLCGFEAALVSDERHNYNISNKIISDIKKSKFLIADFTEQNNGVYFEAGYAMGMKKEVIRLIKKGDIAELHFDTKQFNHIEWERDKWEDLKKELINQIETTIK